MYMSWRTHRIHYTDEGTGRPLVFLHGLGGRASNWTYQRQYFAPRQRVICLELPGHGESEGLDVSFAAYRDVLAALLDHLDIETADMCGLSKGARVGLDLAAQMPRRVRRLVVVNAFAHLEPSDRLERAKLYALLGQPGGRQLWADRLIELMGVQDHSSISNGFRRAASQLNAAHIQRLFNELIEYDQRAVLPRIMAPTLLMRGMHDGFVPEYCVQEMHKLIRRSSMVLLRNTGHLPYLEQPAVFNQYLSTFLEE